MLHKLERLVAFPAKAAAAVAVVLVGLAILADSQWHFTAGWGRLGGGLGKAAGSLALGFAVLAFSYYPLRAGVVRLSQRPDLLPDGAAAGLKQFLTVLRAFHPALGLFACALAGLHGYLLWLPALRKGIAGGTGLAAISLLAIMALTGFLLRAKLARLRPGHRLGAFLFLALLLLHKALT